jgi:hypothetical protein
MIPIDQLRRLGREFVEALPIESEGGFVEIGLVALPEDELGDVGAASKVGDGERRSMPRVMGVEEVGPAIEKSFDSGNVARSKSMKKLGLDITGVRPGPGSEHDGARGGPESREASGHELAA